jgi:hypothetical protein
VFSSLAACHYSTSCADGGSARRDHAFDLIEPDVAEDGPTTVVSVSALW